jgi:hypothetical protein
VRHLQCARQTRDTTPRRTSMTHGSHMLGPSIGLCTQLTALICSRSAGQCERQVLDCSAGDRPNPHCRAGRCGNVRNPTGGMRLKTRCWAPRVKPEKVFPRAVPASPTTPRRAHFQFSRKLLGRPFSVKVWPFSAAPMTPNSNVVIVIDELCRTRRQCGSANKAVSLSLPK